MQHSELTEAHLPCEDCGSSDALSKYSDGHSFCFSCNTYHGNNVASNDNGIYTYEYLPWRGVTKETMQFYDVKTKIDADGQPISLGFKYPNNSFKIRNLSAKEFYSKGDLFKAGLFGQDKFSVGSHKYVTIT